MIQEEKENLSRRETSQENLMKLSESSENSLGNSECNNITKITNSQVDIAEYSTQLLAKKSLEYFYNTDPLLDFNTTLIEY